MNYEKLLKTINTYEIQLFDENLSSIDRNKYMKKLTDTRQQLIDNFGLLAKKNAKFKETLIKETLQFFQFNSNLLSYVQLTDEQFAYCLHQIQITLKDMQVYDVNNVLFANMVERLYDVIAHIRVKGTFHVAKRINDIYSVISDSKKELVIV